MDSTTDAYQALERDARGGAPHPDPGLSGLVDADVCRAEEHDLAVLLALGALCARLRQGESVAHALYSVMDRYTSTSLLYTGRILPRAREVIALLDRSVDERSPEGLVEVAEHLSQGWAGYGDSVFPTALERLARELGAAPEEGAFSEVSFTLWWRALAASAVGDTDSARPLFRESLERYRRYFYYADSAWIYTDLVMAELVAGREADAAAVLEEQRRYVDDVRAAHPPVADTAGEVTHAFHVGDVRSGAYSTFIESSSLVPRMLTERDHTVLRRYVLASEFLLSAFRYGSQSDFEAGVDLFSFGWGSFPHSPYPHFFRHLATRCTGQEGAWDAYGTAQECWRRMLRTYRVRVRPQMLVGRARQLHRRLSHAGLEEHAGLVLLDAAVLHARLHGRAEAVEWIRRHLGELHSTVPRELTAVVDHMQAAEGQEEWNLLSRYLGLRADRMAPEFLSVGVTEQPPAPPRQLEVALYDRQLSIEGITVHTSTPLPLVDVLTELGGELTRSQDSGEAPPFLPASELAARTGRSAAALAQAVRRFRAVCRSRFTEETDWDVAPETIIQGRPGYRMNPESVGTFVRAGS